MSAVWNLVLPASRAVNVNGISTTFFPVRFATSSVSSWYVKLEEDRFLLSWVVSGGGRSRNDPSPPSPLGPSRRGSNRRRRGPLYRPPSLNASQPRCDR